MFLADLMNLVAERRTTTYFKNEAILAVCLAYRVLEYLRPDSHFPKPQWPLDSWIQDAITARNFTEAAKLIWDEVSEHSSQSIDYSIGIERLKKLTAELIARLVAEDQAKMDKAMVE